MLENKSLYHSSGSDEIVVKDSNIYTYEYEVVQYLKIIRLKVTSSVCPSPSNLY